jgi:alcohol dehydrogenase
VNDIDKAEGLLRRFKGDAYLQGGGVLSQLGPWVRQAGDRAALVRGTFPGSDRHVRAIRESLAEAGIELVAEIKGARPNTPKEDVLRITSELQGAKPNVIISFGGGSTIDAVKAADVLRILGGDVEDCFGTDLVAKALRCGGLVLTPHVAVQTVAGSAAHLTKYANVTDTATSQKKLIVDLAIIAGYPAFDYSVTHSTPRDLTADGAFDGIAHMLEVLYGAVGKPHYDQAAEIAATGLPLALTCLPQAMRAPSDARAREALCLATDLGGYAIMIGGTNGGHLTSFSLVDILPHGRACALMNPYYTVFFAPAIEKPLHLLGEVYDRLGLADVDFSALAGRELGVAVAETMLTFARSVGFPTRLADVDGFSHRHINRALAAAKDPQLKMKLANMPVPLTAEMVDDYLGPVLEAARDGSLEAIRSVP